MTLKVTYVASRLLQFDDTSRADRESRPPFISLTVAEGWFRMDSKENRRHAAEAYAHALHTGESSAADRLAPYLAADVVVSDARCQIVGRAAVLASMVDAGPKSEAFRQGGWSEAEAWGDGVVIRAEFPPIGTGISTLTLAFSFDGDDLISAVEKSVVQASRPESTPEIPLAVRGLIDNALHNGTPVVVAYVNEEDEPVQTLRGSTRVFGPTQLSIWLRDREDGLAQAIHRNPKISLLYRDSKSHTYLTVRGRARTTLDEDVCRRVYELAPETEQQSDPERNGTALIIDVIEIRGATHIGGVLVRP